MLPSWETLLRGPSVEIRTQGLLNPMDAAFLFYIKHLKIMQFQQYFRHFYCPNFAMFLNIFSFQNHTQHAKRIGHLYRHLISFDVYTIPLFIGISSIHNCPNPVFFLHWQTAQFPEKFFYYQRPSFCRNPVNLRSQQTPATLRILALHQRQENGTTCIYTNGQNLQ